MKFEKMKSCCLVSKALYLEPEAQMTHTEEIEDTEHVKDVSMLQRIPSTVN